MNIIDLNQLMGSSRPAAPKQEYGVCCGKKMEVCDSRLICLECRLVKTNLGDYGNKPESQKAQYNSYGGVLPGFNTLKTDEEKIRGLVSEFQQKISRNRQICDGEIMRIAAELMFQFSKDNTKKSQNRDQLFGACLYYASIRKRNILLNKDITNMLGLHVRGISTGINLMMKYALKKKIPFEFDPPIYALIIKYYLRCIDISFNTRENRRFCKGLVKEMNALGIAYDKGIANKCSGAVVYYLMYFTGLASLYKKADLTKKMKLTQHVYTPICNLLKEKEINELLSEKYRLKNL